MNFKNERLLIIAPHADDEVLGCFGLIKKIKDSGGKVFVLIVSIGGYNKIGYGKVRKEVWRKEFLQVKKSLGIDDYDIGFFDDKTMLRLDTTPVIDLINMIESETKVSLFKIKPSIIAIPTIFSTHQDHIVIYQACMTALRIRPQTDNHVSPMVVSYESPEYSFWSWYSEFGRFQPNFYLKLKKEEIDCKIDALKYYKSQLRKNHRDEKSIIRLGTQRGSEIGTEYAEAYHIHRLYV
ncbi:MAG TPA: PIG-L family deacetylase [Candidatus Nitrosotalea sp.]|nr:PIG-L family deacetylase [Candidatus Nitrosotalea sp.]